jgi:PAS domain-containing protein
MSRVESKTGPIGDKANTRQSDDHSYRLLVECMNDGAVIITADATVLYCNQSFA